MGIFTEIRWKIKRISRSGDQFFRELEEVKYELNNFNSAGKHTIVFSHTMLKINPEIISNN